MPFFNTLTSKNISISFSDPLFIAAILGITLVTGFLAGSYPSLLLSSFRPVNALRQNTGTILRGDKLRKTLVVFQFSLSVILVLCMLTIYAQINYIRNKDLGLDREQVVMVALSDQLRERQDAFRNEVLKSPVIRDIAFSSHSPLNVGSSTSETEWPGKDPEHKVSIKILGVTHDFVQLMGIELLQGRNFSRDNAADSSNYVVNEEAAKRMGLTDPLGQDITVWGTKGKIIGVIRNFHSTNLHNPFEPLILILRPGWTSTTVIRLEAGKETEALAYLEDLYKKWEPARPFDYRFLDTQFEEMHRTDIVFGKLANSFTGIAIFISCLGLFGLASFTAEKRTKEIGIRKVLGATVRGLIVMLCNDFAKLVIIALLIGSPIAWFLMQKFLEQYAFHAEINAGNFVVAGAGLLMIALLTVIIQSARAAMTNPANVLRNE